MAIFNPSLLLAIFGVAVGFALGLLVQAFSSKLVTNVPELYIINFRRFKLITDLMSLKNYLFDTRSNILTLAM